MIQGVAEKAIVIADKERRRRNLHNSLKQNMRNHNLSKTQTDLKDKLKER